jgi:hypothetical protein
MQMANGKCPNATILVYSIRNSESNQGKGKGIDKKI